MFQHQSFEGRQTISDWLQGGITSLNNHHLKLMGGKELSKPTTPLLKHSDQLRADYLRASTSSVNKTSTQPVSTAHAAFRHTPIYSVKNNSRISSLDSTRIGLRNL